MSTEGRTLGPKDENQLALADKLDVLRTMTRLKARQEVRHALNAAEAELKRAHVEEVSNGSVNTPVLPSAEDTLSSLLGTKQIGSGDKNAG